MSWTIADGEDPEAPVATRTPLSTGVGYASTEVMRTAMIDRRERHSRTLQSRGALTQDPRLLVTADRDMGMSNLAFVPRAGNLSSDTRAG